MRNMLHRLLPALALGGFLLAAGVAEAGLVFNSLNDINFFDRNDAVKTRDSAVTSTATRSTTLRNGDRFYGIFDATGITSSQGFEGPVVTPELTGVFDLTVQFIIAGSNTSGYLAGSVLSDADLAGYDGEAFALFAATNLNTGTLDDGLLGTGTTVLGDGSTVAGLQGVLGSSVIPTGTAIALFQGGTPLVFAGAGETQASDIGEASDGSHLGSFGFTSASAVSDWGAAGNGYWVGRLEYGPGILPPGQSSPSNSFYYGLEALSGPIATTGGGPVPLYNPELAIAGVSPVGTSLDDNYGFTVFIPASLTPVAFDLVGTGNAFVNNAFNNGNSPWPGASSDPAHVYPQPEPGTALLALLGACGVVPVLRRRKGTACEEFAG